MEPTFDLTIIWAGIIGFGLMMYVLMDGFDLGQGILFPRLIPPLSSTAIIPLIINYIYCIY